jgi:hypothetical protein
MKKLLVCLVVTLCSTTVGSQNQFVISPEKKTKKQSVPKIKERIAESYERIAKNSSRLICKLSQSNSALIDGTSELLSGECGSNLADLKTYAAQLAQIELDLAKCEETIDATSRVLEQRVLSKK